MGIGKRIKSVMGLSCFTRKYPNADRSSSPSVQSRPSTFLSLHYRRPPEDSKAGKWQHLVSSAYYYLYTCIQSLGEGLYWLSHRHGIPKRVSQRIVLEFLCWILGHWWREVAPIMTRTLFLSGKLYCDHKTLPLIESTGHHPHSVPPRHGISFRSSSFPSLQRLHPVSSPPEYMLVNCLIVLLETIRPSITMNQQELPKSIRRNKFLHRSMPVPTEIKSQPTATQPIDPPSSQPDCMHLGECLDRRVAD